MKVSQMINESKVFIDQSRATWSQDVISKLPASDKIVGITGVSVLKDMVLIALDSHDQNLVSQVKLKPGEKIFRYASLTTLAGKMKPFIKMNVNKAYAYFLTDDAIENDRVEFESTATKMQFLRLLQGQY